MLDKRLKLYITEEQRKKFMRVFNQQFSRKEYLLFLRKFRGSMISKEIDLVLINYMIILKFILKKY